MGKRIDLSKQPSAQIRALFASALVVASLSTLAQPAGWHAPPTPAADIKASADARFASPQNLAQLQSQGLSKTYSFQNVYDSERLTTNPQLTFQSNGGVSQEVDSRVQLAVGHLGCANFAEAVMGFGQQLRSGIGGFGNSAPEAKMYFYSRIRDAMKSRFNDAAGAGLRSRLEEGFLLLMDSASTLDFQNPDSQAFVFQLATSLETQYQNYVSAKGLRYGCGMKGDGPSAVAKAEAPRPPVEDADPVASNVASHDAAPDRGDRETSRRRPARERGTRSRSLLERVESGELAKTETRKTDSEVPKTEVEAPKPVVAVNPASVQAPEGVNKPELDVFPITASHEEAKAREQVAVDAPVAVPAAPAAVFGTVPSSPVASEEAKTEALLKEEALFEKAEVYPDGDKAPRPVAKGLAPPAVTAPVVTAPVVTAPVVTAPPVAAAPVVVPPPPAVVFEPAIAVQTPSAKASPVDADHFDHSRLVAPLPPLQPRVVATSMATVPVVSAPAVLPRETVVRKNPPPPPTPVSKPFVPVLVDNSSDNPGKRPVKAPKTPERPRPVVAQKKTPPKTSNKGHAQSFPDDDAGNAGVEPSDDALVQRFKRQGVDETALAEALQNYKKYRARGKIKSQRYMVVMDLTRDAGTKRFWVLDMQENKVARSAYVAHGSGNGLGVKNPQRQLAFVSNNNESNASSYGSMLMQGADKDSSKANATKLVGLDDENQNIESRAIKIHSNADYFYHASGKGPDAPPSNYGRSSGCPVLYEEDAEWLQENVPAGTFLYAYKGNIPAVKSRKAARQAVAALH